VETGELYARLKSAYTEENLHQISSRIIDLFRERRFESLRVYQREIDVYTPFREEKINRVFYRLIMFYHPDRLSQFLARLDEAYRKGDFELLHSMSHILSIQHMEPERVGATTILTEEDLAEEFRWEEDAGGYSYYTDESGPDPEIEKEFEITHRSFLIALKLNIYGDLNVDFPVHLLEDLEEIEMADHELESLDGIELCKQARVVDLANNNLTDISELGTLWMVERLYLANNHIGILDPLSNLRELQVLDLSYNDLDDLSPLFELNRLSHLNVLGNRIPPWQLEKMQLDGVTVVA
jgi:hypothetical protein